MPNDEFALLYLLFASGFPMISGSFPLVTFIVNGSPVPTLQLLVVPRAEIWLAVAADHTSVVKLMSIRLPLAVKFVGVTLLNVEVGLNLNVTPPRSEPAAVGFETLLVSVMVSLPESSRMNSAVPSIGAPELFPETDAVYVTEAADAALLIAQSPIAIAGMTIAV